MQDRLLRRREVERITGMSRSSIYRLDAGEESFRGQSGLVRLPSGGRRATSRPGSSRGQWRRVNLASPTHSLGFEG